MRQETAAVQLLDGARQATALATGDVSAFSPASTGPRSPLATDTAEPVVTGYSNRWYVSSLELGKGVVAGRGDSPAGDLRPNFLGRVQPYAVYVPTTYSRRRRRRR